MDVKTKILIVEDEFHIVDFLSARFIKEGLEPWVAGGVEKALEIVGDKGCDIVILDLGLPDRDGMDFIRTIRKTNDIPIIVLSARDGETDKVEALDAGANDYVTKPFGVDELMARIRSAMRIATRSSPQADVHAAEECFGDFTISYSTRKVFVANEEIHLTKTEYEIVEILALNAGRIMTYEDIIKCVWNWMDPSSVKKLQVNMANIRRKLGEKPGEYAYITNELGVGYRMGG